MNGTKRTVSRGREMDVEEGRPQGTFRTARRTVSILNKDSASEGNSGPYNSRRFLKPLSYKAFDSFDLYHRHEMR